MGSLAGPQVPPVGSRGGWGSIPAPTPPFPPQVEGRPLLFSVIYYGIRHHWPEMNWLVAVGVYLFVVPLLFFAGCEPAQRQSWAVFAGKSPGKPGNMAFPALSGQIFQSIKTSAPSGLVKSPEILAFRAESNKGCRVLSFASEGGQSHCEETL